MRRYSTSLIMREMYTKTTVRYFLILVRMTFIKKKTITNIREDVKKKEVPLNTVGSNVKWYSLYGRQCVCVCVCLCVSCVQLFVIP